MKKILLFIILILSFSLGIQLVKATPLTGANADPDQVWFDDNGAFTDETADAISATTNDVKLAEIASQDAHYVGMNYVFDEVIYDIGTAGDAAGTVAWEYWNGGSWSSLTGPSADLFETSGTQNATFTIPGDWATTTVNSVVAYYIRATTTASYLVTVPLANQISVQEYNLKVKVQDELGTALTSLGNSAFTITGGTDNTKYAFREIGSGVYELALMSTGADVNYDYTVEKDGYVTSAAAPTGNLSTTLTDLTGTPASLQFAHKVTGQDELSNSLTGATVTVGGTGCTENSGVYYCPTLLASDGGVNDVIIEKDGYVTWKSNSSDRTTHADSQATYTSTNQFGFKVTSTADELSNSLTTVIVSAGDAYGASCTENGGAWYCPVPIADTNLTIKAEKDGYVTNTGSSFSSDRTAHTDSQVTGAVTNVLFAHKVTGQDELSNSLTGATVTVGGTGCTENSGVYYCPTLLASDGGVNDVIIEKERYVTWETNSTDRTVHTDSQGTYTSANLLLGRWGGVFIPPVSEEIVEEKLIPEMPEMNIKEILTKMIEILTELIQLYNQSIQLLRD